MSVTEKDYLVEAKYMFAKLSSWKEESHKCISTIINSHSISISTGIGNLVKEVSGLKDEVSVLKKERTVLLDTVDLLNCEIRKLNANLQEEPQNELDPKMVEAKKLEEEIFEALEQNESQSNREMERGDMETGEIHDTNIHEGDEDNITDISENGQDTEDNTKRQYNNHAEPDNAKMSNEKMERNTCNLNSFTCSECNFEFSTQENIRTHLKNIHSRSEMSSKPEELDESNVGNDNHKMNSLAMNYIKGVHNKKGTIHVQSVAIPPHGNAI